jgi:hypothetical protein
MAPVDVRYSIPDDENAPLYAAAELRPDKPIRLRFQPDIFMKDRAERGLYCAWRGVHWTLDCQTPDEAIELKQALGAFFKVAAEAGPDEAMRRLQKVAA